MRVILAEDSTLLREGLVRLLAEEGHEVLVALGDAVTLLKEVEEQRPDIVVVDIRMPPTHTDEGLRAAVEIRERWPEVSVLVLSQHIERHYAAKLLASNAERIGYLLKDRVAQVEEFLDALERIHAAWSGDRPGGRTAVGHPDHPRGPARAADAPGADRPGGSRAGAHERGHRGEAAPLAEFGGEEPQRRLRQTGAVPHDRLQPHGSWRCSAIWSRSEAGIVADPEP